MVRGFFSSPRRRRRTFVAGVALVLVSGITFSMIHWSNTSHYRMAPIRYNEKAQVYTPPVKRDYRKAKQEGVLLVAAKFVNTAVKREHVADSFDLTTATLHTGYTRKAWATQDIPVVPYPVDFAKYQVKGSFTDSVWYQVAVFPDRAHATVPAAVYDLVLKPSGNGASRHWLVDSWAPAGYQGIRRRRSAAAAGARPGTSSSTRARCRAFGCSFPSAGSSPASRCCSCSAHAGGIATIAR